MPEPSGHSFDAAADQPVSEGRDSAIFLVCLLASCVILAGALLPLFSRTCYIADDLGDFHIPIRHFYSQCLKNGSCFWWMPDLFSGFYLHGEGQVGMLHPLHFILYRLLPLDIAFNMEQLLSYPFVLLGFYLMLRRWELRRGSAMFGAMSFTFCGFFMLHHIHVNALTVFSHAPWLILCAEVLVKPRSVREARYAVAAITLLTASQALLGYPHYVMFTFITEAVCLLSRHGRRLFGPFLLQLAWAKIVGLAIGAVQILPTVEVLKSSIRSSPTESFRCIGSVPPASLMQFVMPYLFRFRHYPQNTADYGYFANMYEFGFYCGCSVTILALWFVASRFRTAGARRFPLVMAAAILTLVVLAMGEYGFLYGLQTSIPPFNVFRYPSRYMVIASFCLASLAAVAVDTIQSSRNNRVNAALFVPLCLASSACAVAMALRAVHGNVPPAFYIASPVLIVTSVCIVAMATLIVAFCVRRGSWLLITALAIFAAADLGVYGLSGMWHRRPVALDKFVAERANLPRLDPGMRFDSGLYSEDQWIMNGAKLTWGYMGLHPRRMLSCSDITAQRLACVKWRQSGIITNVSSDGARQKIVKWAAVPDPMPRARLVSRAIVSTDPSADLRSIEISSTALVDEDLRIEDGPAGEATILSDLPGDVTIRASCDSRQLLILSESYHPGWIAFVDGSRRKATRVYGDFIGCVLEPGEHAVRFRFLPASLLRGIWVSLLGLAIMCLQFFLPQLGRREK